MNTLDKGYPYVLVSRIGKGELSSLLPLLHFVEKEDAPVFGADVYKNIFKTAFTVVLEDGGQIGKKGKSIFKSKKHLSEEGRLAVTLVNATQKRLSMNSVRRYIRHVGLETCMKMNVGSFFDTETDCYQEALFVKLLSECLDCSVAKLGVEEPHLNYVNTMTDPLYTYFNTNPLAVITTVAATKKFREVRALPGSTFSYDDVTRRRRQYHKLPKKTFSYPYYSNPSYEPETGKDSFIKPTFVPLATPTPLIDFATRFGTNCTMRVPTLQSVSSSSKPLHAALKFLLESNFRSDKQWNYFVEEQYYLEFIRETRLFASYGGKTRKKYHTTGMYYEYDTAQSLLEVRVLDDVVDMACQWGSVWFQTLKGELYVCNLETRVLVDPHSVDDVGTNRITFDFKDTSASLKRIKAGFDNAVIFSNTDAVCMNGLNNYGQCLKPPCKKTISISFRTGRIPLRDIATGTNFGVAVYEDGVLGTWGVTKMIGDAFPVDKVMDSVKLTDADVVEPCLPVIHSHSKSTHLQDIKVDKVFAGYSHAAFISEEKKIYTWGCGKSGKLGHGTEEGQKYPKEIAFFEKIPVVTAALGMDSTAVISIEGKLYVFGGNSANEIGLLTIKEPTFKPTLVNLPQKAVSVATSGRSTWVLLVDGDLMACGRYPVCGVSVGEGDGFVGFTRIMTTYLTFGLATAPLTTALRCRQRDIHTCFFGTFADEDMNFPFLNHLGKRPRKVVSGRGFYTVLSENFNLYTTARGSVDLAASQLHDPSVLEEKMSERRGEGREESESQEANESVSADESNDGVSKEDATRPMPVLTRVKSLQDYRVMNVCCGPDYVVAHTFDNVLFGWGKNVFGILNEDMSIVEYTIHEPCQVDVPPEIRCFRQVACGGTFMVLSTGKKLYVKGNTAYCGLGDRIHESVRCITHPLGASVATFSRMLIQDTFACVAAGERHAMALAYSGVLYCWGDFSGIGRIMTTPVRVALPGEAARIGCGPSNSFMITKDRTLWVWGDNSNNQCGLSPKEGESLPTTITAPQKVALNVREFGITNDMSVVIYENGDVSLGGEASFQGDTHTGTGFEDTVNFQFDDKLVVSISPDADDVQDGVSEGTSMPPLNRAPPSSTNHTKEKDFFGVGVFPGWEVIHIMVERNRYIPK